ncbi:hypothetical protein CC80DRAFT_456989 [Byssothecium circinans]|uniref:Uncharacterized protein n=1 Tax=Byssothecium circinans TaxID=147558 RepID=A0A6A5TBM6_9PLEO|nr:hypothetical protein CC80DRAFT_456989 [Byssothecium circinans]
MPSFKSKILSACAWALPVLSVALPLQDRRPDAVRPDGKLLELDFQESYAQATFSVPCVGCLGQDHTSHDDESIILSFKTHANDEACGTSNITLNGVYLPQEWNGDVASGSASYTGVTDWFLQHDLDLEWESACLHGEQETDDAAQVLTVNIRAIDGKALDNPTGFTVSFKQQQTPPELLRLESVPNRSASNKEHAQSWRQPPVSLRIALSAESEELQGLDFPVPPSLEDEISELRALQAEAKKLQEVIDRKEAHIESQTKQAAESFKEKLQECDSITCVVKTISTGAHRAWRVLYVKFRPKHYQHPPMGGPQNGNFHGLMTSSYKQIPEGNVNIESDAHHDDSPPPPPDPPGPHHGPPHMPPPGSPFVIAIEVVLGLLCCGCLFTVVRHRCSSLRTRTERAALREERRTARAYRRAARKHAWGNWWRGNWRDRARIEDYEEKRSLIQHQETVLEDAMQEEIRQLRAAHGIVNDIVGAEEGRLPHTNTHAHIHCHYAHPTPQAPLSPISTASTYPPTSLPELPSRPLSRTDSLPGYASSSPPAYEEDEDVSDVVANGFRNYAPSTSSSSASSGWTADSSVVDVSPRPSADTLRYPEERFAETTDTGVGEKN